MKKPIPRPASNAPKGTVWFGGPIPWFSITLSISADDLAPDDVTRLVGIQPDDAERKGMPLPSRGDRAGRTPTFGRWSIRLRREETTEWDLEEAINIVLDRVAVENEVWAKAVGDAKVRFFVGLTLDTRNRGFGLSPNLLKRIGSMGAHLDFDVYSDFLPS